MPGGKCISVVVVGVPATALDFAGSDALTLRHRGYTIRLLNFTGGDTHIGRRILVTNPDIVLNTIDSTDLENSLRLATRLIDMDTFNGSCTSASLSSLLRSDLNNENTGRYV